MTNARPLLFAGLRWLVPGSVIVVPLIVNPSLERPFTSAKIAALALIAGLLAARASVTGTVPVAPAFRWLAGAWIATLALSALFGSVAVPGGLWLETVIGLALMALLQAPPERDLTFKAIAIAGSLVAGVACLQMQGFDPFALAGWEKDHPGVRMRIYGTLGNPDFVAAFLGATLCVTLGAFGLATRKIDRTVWVGACALQVAALGATRSWATLLALGAAGLGYGASELLSRRGPRRRIDKTTWMAALALLAGLAIVTPWDRPLATILEGRAYLLRVAAPHIAERPLLGHGPGSVAILWPAWEAAYWTSGGEEKERRFIAEQDHLHNDYLEWLVELGAAGALPRLLLLAAALFVAWRASDLQSRAVAAALTALCMRALVDFPLDRPAELYLAAILVTLSLQHRGSA